MSILFALAMVARNFECEQTQQVHDGRHQSSFHESVAALDLQSLVLHGSDLLSGDGCGFRIFAQDD